MISLGGGLPLVSQNEIVSFNHMAGYESSITCPNCAESEFRRSHRKNLREHLISWVGVYPFRCQNCQERFWLIHNRAWLEKKLQPFPLAVIFFVYLLSGLIGS